MQDLQNASESPGSPNLLGPFSPISSASASSPPHVGSASDDPPLPLGFIGLGHMGRAILKTLLESDKIDFPVVIYHENKYEEVDDNTNVISDRPADVIRRSHITFVCESEVMSVEDVFFSKKGVLAGLDELRVPSEKKKSIVMLATIDPDLSKKIYAEICKRNGLYLEAPVSGTLEMAKAKKLEMIVAGSDTLLRECKEYFKIFAPKVFHCSTHDIGQALHLKIFRTLLAGTERSLTKEAVALAKNENVPSKNIHRYLDPSRAKCPQFQRNVSAAIKNKKETIPDIDAQLNDMAIAHKYSGMHTYPMPITTTWKNSLLWDRRELVRDQQEKMMIDLEEKVRVVAKGEEPAKQEKVHDHKKRIKAHAIRRLGRKYERA